MKFKQLTLKNFRQFKGEFSVNFASDENKNVTLIFGSNGFGKTGIFRAIMFCLYGTRYLKQDNLTDDEIRKGHLVLVNEKMLEENQEKEIVATVQLDFEDKNKNYSLIRSIKARKTGIDIVQEPCDVSLSITENHNTCPPIIDGDEIKEKISSIIDSKIKDFFLFDGEQMEELTKYSKESKNEIKKGIKTLLQLDAIEITKESLSKVSKEINKQIEMNASGQLGIISEELTKKHEDLENIKNELMQLENNIKKAEIDKNNIEKIIEANKEVMAKQKDREIIRENIANCKRDLDSLKQKLKEQLSKSGSYVAAPIVAELESELSSKIDKGEIPDGLKREFIDKLLNQCRCICGNNLNEHPEARIFLEEYKNRNSSQTSDAALKAYHTIVNLKAEVKISENIIDSTIASYDKIQKDYIKLNNRLEKYNDELKDIKGFEDYSVRLKKIKEDLRSYDVLQGRLEVQQDGLISKVSELKIKQNALTENDSKVQKLMTQRTIIDFGIEELESIYKNYSDELRQTLSACATDIFKKIADVDTLKSLSGIIISEDFQLEVLSHSGTILTSQMSAGQRQIVSLSYICALLQIGSNLEMPLLMDTPFGRLDGSHRDACLKNLPSLLSQWILLATDTEFQSEESTALRSSNKWDKVYELSHISDRCSTIEQKDINNWIPRRKITQGAMV